MTTSIEWSRPDHWFRGLCVNQLKLETPSNNFQLDSELFGTCLVCVEPVDYPPVPNCFCDNIQRPNGLPAQIRLWLPFALEESSAEQSHTGTITVNGQSGPYSDGSYLPWTRTGSVSQSWPSCPGSTEYLLKNIATYSNPGVPWSNSLRGDAETCVWGWHEGSLGYQISHPTLYTTRQRTMVTGIYTWHAFHAELGTEAEAISGSIALNNNTIEGLALPAQFSSTNPPVLFFYNRSLTAARDYFPGLVGGDYRLGGACDSLVGTPGYPYRMCYPIGEPGNNDYTNQTVLWTQTVGSRWGDYWTTRAWVSRYDFRFYRGTAGTFEVALYVSGSNSTSQFTITGNVPWYRSNGFGNVRTFTYHNQPYPTTGNFSGAGSLGVHPPKALLEGEPSLTVYGNGGGATVPYVAPFGPGVPQYTDAASYGICLAVWRSNTIQCNKNGWIPLRLHDHYRNYSASIAAGPAEFPQTIYANIGTSGL